MDTINGMVCGYARVSTTDQNLDAQLDALEKAGCEKIWQEKVSGANRKDRSELTALLKYLREGDTLVVTKLDRLGRNSLDLQQMIKELDDRKVSFKILNLGVDTSTPAGKMILTIMGAIAENERSLIRERQAEGIAQAKAKGVYTAGRPSANKKAIFKLLEDGLHYKEIQEQLGISERTVFKYKKQFENTSS